MTAVKEILIGKHKEKELIQAISSGKSDALSNSIDKVAKDVKVYTSYKEFFKDLYIRVMTRKEDRHKLKPFHYELRFNSEDQKQLEMFTDLLERSKQRRLEKNREL